MSFNYQIAAEMLEEAKLILDIGSAIPVDKPSLVILGGQPGSGKSSAIEMIEAIFNDNIFALNGDDFKELYPNYEELLKTNQEQTTYDIQPYSNYVVNQLKAEYSNQKYNMIIEGTMRTSEVPLATIEEFKAKGYQTEAYVVASHYYASRTGCLHRMEIDISNNGYGRAVPIESHDAAYNNIPSTMQVLIQSGKLENLTVMSRSGEILGELKNGDNVVEIYQNQRNQLSQEQYEQINTSLNEILELMHKRNASSDEIEKIVNLQAEFQNYYTSKINAEKIAVPVGKFILTDEKFEVKIGVNTNEDVLRYFEQYDTDNRIAKWRDTGKVETSKTFHFLAEENPERLGLILNSEFNTNISVELPEVLKQQYAEEFNQNEIE